jgi:hypothetical protein
MILTMTETVSDTTVTRKECDRTKADICRTWVDDDHRVLEHHASTLRLNDICFLLMIIISDIREAQLKTNIFLVSTPNGD